MLDCVFRGKVIDLCLNDTKPMAKLNYKPDFSFGFLMIDQKINSFLQY